jgi:hypothetical protein
MTCLRWRHAQRPAVNRYPTPVTAKCKGSPVRRTVAGLAWRVSEETSCGHQRAELGVSLRQAPAQWRGFDAGARAKRPKPVASSAGAFRFGAPPTSRKSPVQRPAAMGQAARSLIACDAMSGAVASAGAIVAVVSALEETTARGCTTTEANCTKSSAAKTMAAVTPRVRVMESSLKIDDAEEIALRSVASLLSRASAES